MEFFEKIVGFFRDRIQKLTDEEKKRLALICTAAVSLVLIVSVLLSLKGKKENKLPTAPERFAIQAVIPAEEIFLPDEPDFVPGVILERDRRSSWTEEDALVYWQDPLKNGEEPWREKIEKAIDELLENVP